MINLSIPVINRLPIITAAFLVLTNIIVLAGVAYNRSGEPAASLKLTERELSLPYRSYKTKSKNRVENSGLALRLKWSIIPTNFFDNKYNRYALQSYGTPNWLTDQKLKELGFDVGNLITELEDPLLGYRKLESEDVIIVLEYNGEAYQTVLNEAEKDIQHYRNKAKIYPDDEELIKQLKRYEDSLAELKTSVSRLIAIDAGLDLQTLKQKYNDKSKYLMLRGEVRHYWSNKNLTSRIKNIFINNVHVPLPYSDEINELTNHEPTISKYNHRKDKPHYQVELKVGKRLEPWVGGVDGL